MKRLPNRDKRSLALAIGLLAVIAAIPGHAIDGAREINQTRAGLGGVTAGDTAGFPVTIDEPGSYVLTSNLAVADGRFLKLEVRLTRGAEAAWTGLSGAGT